VKSFVTTLVSAGLFLALAGTPAIADSWCVGLGAGYADHYSYGTIDILSGQYDLFLEDAPVITVSATSNTSRGLALQTGLDAFRADDRTGLSLEMVSLSAGPRFSLRASGPYVEFLPALYLARWSDNELGGLDSGYSGSSSSLTSIRPGFSAGAGVRALFGDVGFEFGAGYRFSSDWPGLGGEDEFQGARQWIAGGKLLLRM
jgi:hypothetical protein